MQVYWPARRLSAPNLGLVRMNSVSEEQEEQEEEEEEEEEQQELLLKATKNEEGKTRVANYTEGSVPTIQLARSERMATKKEFSGPLPLAVG